MGSSRVLFKIMSGKETSLGVLGFQIELLPERQTAEPLRMHTFFFKNENKPPFNSAFTPGRVLYGF